MTNDIFYVWETPPLQKGVKISTSTSVFPQNQEKKIYILKKCRFYEDPEIIMVSENYKRVKNFFNEELRGHSKGYGYQIIEMELDKKCEEEKIIDEIEHHNEGFKVFAKASKEIIEEYLRGEFKLDSLDDRTLYQRLKQKLSR